MGFFDKTKKNIGIGIEIDGNIVRVVKSSGQKNQTKIDWVGSFQLAADETVQNSKNLKDFFREHQIQKKWVATNIESPDLRIRRMELPPMPEQDLINAIKFNLRDQVEGNIEDYEIRYSILGKTEGSLPKQEMVVYGIPNTLIRNQLELFKDLGAKLEVLEPASVSIAAWFDHLYPNNTHINAIVHFGNFGALFVVVSEGKFLFSRPLENVLGLDLQDIHSFDSPDIILQYSLNIQKSIDSFCLIFRQEKVDRLILSGKLVNTGDFTDYLKRNLGLTVELIDQNIGSSISLAPGVEKNQLIYFTIPLALSITPI